MRRVTGGLLLLLMAAGLGGCKSAKPADRRAEPEVVVERNEPRPRPAFSLDDTMAAVGEDLIRQAGLDGEATVAVLPLVTADGEAGPLGVVLADKLAHGLVVGKRCIVADRMHVAAVLAEKDMTAGGIAADPGAVGAASKLLAVRYLITGTLADAGRVVEVTVKLLDGENGRQAASASVQVPKTDEVMSILAAGGGIGGKARGLVSVVREGDRLVVSVVAKGADELGRLQAGRQRCREVYADYVLANITPGGDRQGLMEYARDYEEVVDARQEGEVLQLVLRYRLVKER